MGPPFGNIFVIQLLLHIFYLEGRFSRDILIRWSDSMHKKCTDCGIEKKLISENYSKRNSSKDGFDSHCKECKKKRDAARYEKKSKEILKQKKEYYQANREKVINRQANYYRENKEVCHLRSRLWQKENPLKRRLIGERRRTREVHSVHTLTEKEWNDIKKYFNSSCAYCGITEVEHVAKNGERLHHEHVIPLTSGGAYDKSNVVPSCRSCNSSKSNRNVFFWYTTSKGYSKKRLEKLEFFLKGVENSART